MIKNKMSVVGVKDKSGKNIRVGDKVKFFTGDSPRDPFRYWVTGFVILENGILGIREDPESEGCDGLYSAHNKKELEIIDAK